jgi:hypothetical protein
VSVLKGAIPPKITDYAFIKRKEEPEGRRASQAGGEVP